MTWKIEAQKHAEICLPDESCGLLALIKGKKKYWPCKNLSVENFDYFIIDPDDWAECEILEKLLAWFILTRQGQFFLPKLIRLVVNFRIKMVYL